ncbi:hypothetical protein [Paracoccus sp. KR1-242]|uniref:hypothetical protein n=1 Tax=Paracoccus sp. KR1-242 TaxID=3410028 RepID=UPI003BFA9A3E
MGGPWEDFQPQTAQEDGPWADFAPAKQDPQGGRRAIASTKDGGTIWELSDGKRVFSSPNYSTSDPEQIAELMEGATPADVSMSGWNEGIIDQNPVKARALKAVEGVPFVGSYADETVGAVYGDQARDAWRSTSRAMDEEKPLQSAGLQLAGGVAATVPALMATGPGLAAESLAGNMLRGGLFGMGEGAVRGFGRGEDNPNARFRTGLTDMVMGGAVGAVAPAVAHGAGALYRAGRNALADHRGVGSVANALGISKKAGRLLSDTLEMDDLTRMRTAINDAGQDAMLADAGPTTRNALDFVTQAPGEGARTALRRIDDRATAAGGRLNDALDQSLTGNNVGAPGGRQFSDTARLQADVRQATAPARKAVYDAAYARPIDYASQQGRALLDDISPRLPQEVIGYANKLMRMKGEKSAQIMASIADDGTVTFTNPPDVRQWDYIKRALDGLAETSEGTGALGAQTTMGGAFKNLARDIRTNLGQAVPEYDYAVNTAGDIIGEIKALKTGETLLRDNVTRAEAEAALDGMSQVDRAAVKRGLRVSIDDAVANVKAIASDPNMDAREAYKSYQMLSGRAAQDKMKMLLKEDWPPLKTALDEAASALRLRASVGGNSKTGMRGEFKQMFEDANAPGDFRLGKPIPTAQGFWQRFTGATPSHVQRANAATRNELADVLTRPNALATLNAFEGARAAFPLLPGAGAGVTNALNGLGLASLPTSAGELRNRLLPR